MSVELRTTEEQREALVDDFDQLVNGSVIETVDALCADISTLTAALKQRDERIARLEANDDDFAPVSTQARGGRRMKILVQGGAKSIAMVQEQMPSFECWQLISPLGRDSSWPGRFAIDNGAFVGFDAAGFQTLLAREQDNRDRCLFVAAPDVVGSARRTAEVFQFWYPKLERWPIAYVAQDGIEDLPIPWNLIAAVFIGGTTEWKLSNAAASVISAAQAMGKWTHVGRVNTPQRVDKFLAMSVDSVDGQSLARHGKGYARDRRKIESLINQPRLIA